MMDMIRNNFMKTWHNLVKAWNTILVLILILQLPGVAFAGSCYLVPERYNEPGLPDVISISPACASSEVGKVITFTSTYYYSRGGNKIYEAAVWFDTQEPFAGNVGRSIQLMVKKGMHDDYRYYGVRYTGPSGDRVCPEGETGKNCFLNYDWNVGGYYVGSSRMIYIYKDGIARTYDDGSSNVIGEIRASDVRVSGNYLTVTWEVKFRDFFAGKNLYSYMYTTTLKTEVEQEWWPRIARGWWPRMGTLDIVYPTTTTLPQQCTLDIYVWDETHNSLDANVYVDGSYYGYNDHLTVTISTGTHVIEGSKPGYTSDEKTVHCSCGETKRVDLILSKIVENQPPVANAGPDQTVYEGTSVTLNGCGSYDPDGYIVSYEWMEGSSLLSESVEFSRIFPVGTHYITLRVTDDDGASDTDTVVVKVLENHVYSIDVYDVETSPQYVDEGEDVTISGRVKLVDAPVGYHEVIVEWFVDGMLEHTKTLSMSESESEYVSWSFDTTGLSEGVHEVRIKARIDDISDEDSTHFHVGEAEGVEIELGNLNVDPEYICVNEGESIELWVAVTLEEGPDDTPVTAKFYVRNGGWEYVGKVTKDMNEGETRTFRIYYYYSPYELDVGTHEVKVIVEGGDDEEVEYGHFYVDSCRTEYDVSVGSITLTPEYPTEGEIITASVPVTLQASPTLPASVDLEVYINGGLLYSTNMIFESLTEKEYVFTIDTVPYGSGTHTLTVKAKIGGVTDTSERTFTIGAIAGFKGPEHCLSVDKIWVSQPLKAGKKAEVHVTVSSCGSESEVGTRVRVLAFSKIYYDGEFTLSSGDTRDVVLYVRVPSDASGTETFAARVWNRYTTDELSKDFVIYTGIPLIEVEKEYRVEECKLEAITLYVMNVGEVEDTFTLNVSGPGAGWITGIPQTIVLSPGEKKNITAYVSVPCDTSEGYYPFTVTAQNSQTYSITSNFHVVKPFVWPRLFTGFFSRVSKWLPWLLLALFILVLLCLLFLSFRKLGGIKVFGSSRREPMFGADC